MLRRVRDREEARFCCPIDGFHLVSFKDKTYESFISIYDTYFRTNDPHKNVALNFASQSPSQADIAAVLLQVEIDVKKCQTPFADASRQNEFAEEKEILFSMGAVFRIKEIEKMNNGIHLIKLELTDEEDLELQQLTKLVRDEITDS